MKKNNKKGFTLVELVIVVAVMAVLVAVAIPTIGSIKSSADSAVLNTNCRTMESIIKLEEAEKSNAGATLDAAGIVAAINEAKLGIETGTYSYLSNGQVVSGSAASGTDVTVVATWTFTSGVAAAGAGTGTGTGGTGTGGTGA